MGLALGMLAATPACAYRPFDGTDAAVPDFRELEVEFQPFGFLRGGGERSLIAPQAVVNYGLAPDLEVTTQGQLDASLGGAGASLQATGVGGKYVFREGVLQDKPGVSLATELLALTPGLGADRGFGVSLAGLASQRYDWGTLHLTLQPELTRDRHADLFVGAIVEGPADWPVRPVAELFYEDEIAKMRQASMLLGLIYQLSDKLAFDLAARAALVKATPAFEIRAGFTLGVPTAPDRVEPASRR